MVAIIMAILSSCFQLSKPEDEIAWLLFLHIRIFDFSTTGCGTGNYTVALSEYVGKVTGLEMNEGMLGRAMEKTATLKNVSLTQGDITKMPFQDNQFDGICCNQVYYS